MEGFLCQTANRVTTQRSHLLLSDKLTPTAKEPCLTWTGDLAPTCQPVQIAEQAKSETYNERNWLPNDPQEYRDWWCRFPDMCAGYCSGRKSHASARLAITVFNPERKIPKTMGEWYQLCFYNNLDNDLRAGRAVTYGPIGGKTISVAEGYRIVAHARAEGWLPPLCSDLV